MTPETKEICFIDSPEKLIKALDSAMSELEELQNLTGKPSLSSAEKVFKAIFETHAMATAMGVETFKKSAVFSLIHETSLPAKEIYQTQKCLDNLSIAIESWDKNMALKSTPEINCCYNFFSKLFKNLNVKIN